ncbi:hypothetical protein [Citrobacter sp. RHBSTW-00271]|uniref:hypothetical protein n=1 Tax=Citrobacter sp. RHBSTW-00271 TaxID=2742642 RepID=UPI0020179B4D|nr:hypothetical protein [Citrobacter sp. RHBSTW-00271]
MFNRKNKKSPANIKESLDENADRFYKMFRIHTTSKVVISVLALAAAGVSAFNIYDKYQESEGRMDHIAVVRISGNAVNLLMTILICSHSILVTSG